MALTENGFYIIDDQFFIDFPDPYLRGNHQENRPHYYCFKEKDTSLYWVIPLSFQIDKYKKIIEKKRRTKKPCDILHILKIAGRESVFLIQDMFPITEKYIKREYTIDNIPLKLLNKKQINQLNKKARKILVLIRKGIILNPTQPNVLKVEEELLKKG
ncbi:MAG: hypothetical protein FH756_00055 [Firmicutes bacterium]|nr:hypothetical protein [Bacillota bacterium]